MNLFIVLGYNYLSELRSQSYFEQTLFKISPNFKMMKISID